MAAAEGAAASLKVSGAATLATETRATATGFEVRVSLSDEVGRPLTGAELRVRATPSDGAASLQRCGQGRAEGDGELTLTTDNTGHACIAVSGMPRGALDVSFEDPRGYFERAQSTVQIPQSAEQAFEVGFDPPLSTLPLDRPLQEIGLVARGRPGAALPDAAELVLSLVADGSEKELSRIALDGLGEVHRLSLVSASFGAPGPARLVARLRSRGGVERALASLAVLRTATVVLQVSPEVEAVEPGSTVQVRAASMLGPTPSGTIEARSRGRSVAAARVQNGVATLNLPLSPVALLGSSITLEYLSESPGWLSGPALSLAARPTTRSYGWYVLWVAAAALAALAVVLGWRRPPRPRPSLAPPSARPRASVEVIESFGAAGGYRGQVCDAHDGTPVSPAAISFVVPGPGPRVLMQVMAQADGSFTVDSQAFPGGCLVEVTAPFHATLTAPLPGPGVLKLSLVSRRRSLLDRLVQWAERHGVPWTRPGGDPTPAHVAGVADSESEVTVGRWARQVERLAYGPNPPDAASEQAAGVAEEPKTLRERGID